MADPKAASISAIHGPAGPAEYDTEKGGWVRACLCGRTFVSYENWRHVPALYDHLATLPREAQRVD